MKLAGAYQALPTYAYCASPCGCGWHAAAKPEGQIEDEAEAHARTAGHQTRVVSTTQLTFSPVLAGAT